MKRTVNSTCMILFSRFKVPRFGSIGFSQPLPLFSSLMKYFKANPRHHVILPLHKLVFIEMQAIINTSYRTTIPFPKLTKAILIPGCYLKMSSYSNFPICLKNVFCQLVGLNQVPNETCSLHMLVRSCRSF